MSREQFMEDDGAANTGADARIFDEYSSAFGQNLTNSIISCF